MECTVSCLEDFPLWLSLAREVEPLFGPMADVPEFQSALQAAINEGRALCIRDTDTAGACQMGGGVIFDKNTNEILWLVVSQVLRGRGAGRLLLNTVIERMDPTRPIRVQTYDGSVEAGMPARHLYINMGFQDLCDGGRNPAGFPTVIMERPVFQAA